MTEAPTKDADTEFARIVSAADTNLDIRELLRCVMVEFGGPPGMARELFRCYDDLTKTVDGEDVKGHQNQVRILSDIMRLLAGVGDTQDPAEESTEALEAVIRQAVGE